MDQNLADMAATAYDTAMTCSFLSAALSDKEIGVDFLKTLAGQKLETGTELDAYAAGLAGRDLDAARLELAADHSRLFLGMSKNPVSPYESVYTSEEQLMMQGARDAVVAAYARAGLETSVDVRVPEDHISIELDFVGKLAMREYENLQAGATACAQATNEERKLFVDEHLKVWTPRFCEMLQDKAATAFYRGVGQMLRTFIETQD